MEGPSDPIHTTGVFNMYVRKVGFLGMWIHIAQPMQELKKTPVGPCHAMSLKWYKVFP